MIGQTIGRYHIIEQLGKGGMATDYKAYDNRLEREVAVKLIRKEAFGTAVLERILKRFEREAKSLARLSHTNIINIFDYGQYEGAPYLVMEYMSGKTLKDRLGAPMKPEDAAKLLVPIAQALNHSHKLGIVHRDVKPSNILIDMNGDPKLTDFGIARLLDYSDATVLTATGVGVGTPEYMAPEQGLGKDVDERTDIYSLGVVFFEMITGKKPFQADTPMAVVVKHINDPLPSPDDLVPGVSEKAKKIIFKAMAKEPENRYQSMKALALAFEKVSLGVEDEPGITHDDLGIGFLATERKTKKAETGKVGGVLKKIPLWGWIVAVGFLITLGLVFFLGLGKDGVEQLIWITSERPSLTATSSTFSIPITKSTPTKTSINSNEATPSGTSTQTGQLVGLTQVSELDGMVQVYIPAGEFQMGSEDGSEDESPVHTVYLDAFWIDQNEVTLDQYNQFLEDEFYSANPCGDGDDYPVACVDWKGAQAYCLWAGRRLPTEAEWEKAARGGLEGKKYPWGNEDPVCEYGAENGAQYNKCEGITIPVKSFAPNGYGAYDMAGNVWEWVSDWYSSDYYEKSPNTNPRGPVFGTEHVLRGVSWDKYYQYGKVASRKKYGDFLALENVIGFRCAQSLTNQVAFEQQLMETSRPNLTPTEDVIGKVSRTQVDEWSIGQTSDAYVIEIVYGEVMRIPNWVEFNKGHIIPTGVLLYSDLGPHCMEKYPVMRLTHSGGCKGIFESIEAFEIDSSGKYWLIEE